MKHHLSLPDSGGLMLLLHIRLLAFVLTAAGPPLPSHSSPLPFPSLHFPFFPFPFPFPALPFPFPSPSLPLPFPFPSLLARSSRVTNLCWLGPGRMADKE